MIALGVGTVWVGYYLFMYGYCLVRGYDVSIGQLMGATWPGSGKSNPAADIGKNAGSGPATSGGGGGRSLAV